MTNGIAKEYGGAVRYQGDPRGAMVFIIGPGGDACIDL